MGAAGAGRSQRRQLMSLLLVDSGFFPQTEANLDVV
jgi:hypothetical protein